MPKVVCKNAYKSMKLKVSMCVTSFLSKMLIEKAVKQANPRLHTYYIALIRQRQERLFAMCAKKVAPFSWDDLFSCLFLNRCYASVAVRGVFDSALGNRVALIFCTTTSPLLLHTNISLSPAFSFSARLTSAGTVICPLVDILAKFIIHLLP